MPAHLAEVPVMVSAPPVPWGTGVAAVPARCQLFLEAPTAVQVLRSMGLTSTQPRVACLGMWVLSPKGSRERTDGPKGSPSSG